MSMGGYIFLSVGLKVGNYVGLAVGGGVGRGSIPAKVGFWGRHIQN